MNPENDELNFNLPSDILDEIQQNIEDIIIKFDVPEENKLEVIKKINYMYSQTRQMSVTDGLTGLYNRRHFEVNLEREFLRAKRYNSELSLAVIDVDWFKKVNDTYGHSCGDYILKEVSYAALETFRKTDMVFRYGGEEFTVILTETPLSAAVIPLERLRKTIESKRFIFHGQEIKITVSAGVSQLTEDINVKEELFDKADKALYEAKENGRNLVKTL